MDDNIVFAKVYYERAKKALEELLHLPETSECTPKTPREQLENALNHYSNIAHYEVDQRYDLLVASATTKVGGRTIAFRKEVYSRFLDAHSIEQFARDFVEQFSLGVSAKIREKSTALTDPTAIEIEDFYPASPSEFDIEL